MDVTKTVAPLRSITSTEQSTTKLDLGELGSFEVPLLIFTLACGHKSEMMRAGCRLPAIPKRRRCKEC